MPTSSLPATSPEPTTRTGKVPTWVGSRSNRAGAVGVTTAVRPRPGISTSAPNGAVTPSRRRSPSSIRAVFRLRPEIPIRVTRSSP
ncbi:MAG: hypothetical protein ACRDKV_06475, partial [Solirubrobacterales bacterium]